MNYLKIALTIFLAFFIFILIDRPSDKRSTQAGNFDSPESKITKDTNIERYQKTLIDFDEPESNWEPKEKYGTSSQPEIAGESGLIIDLETDKILFEKNSEQKMKIASLTKIMTAVIALEHKNLGDKIQVDAEAASIGENSMGVSEGEVYTLRELMYGLMLPSGNDAAYAISKGVAGNVENFVEWMNIKAKELGLKNTYFADPSGLDDTTYSTPLDLAKLTRYAMRNQNFREFVRAPTIELTGDSHKYLFFENQTNLLTTYPGVAGVKTGFTQEAGLCLVTYAKNAGHELIGVVLNSVDRKGDMILMLDHGFGTIGINVVHNLLDY